MLAAHIDIPKWVTNYIGLEFKETGREEKYDCWGLIRFIFSKEYDIEIPRYDEYESTKELEKIDLLMQTGIESNEWHKIPHGNEAIGDVIVFKIRGHLCHVGLCVGNKYMVHIQKGKNACLEFYHGIRWEKRVCFFYRHKKMNED